MIRKSKDKSRHNHRRQHELQRPQARPALHIPSQHRPSNTQHHTTKYSRHDDPEDYFSVRSFLDANTPSVRRAVLVDHTPIETLA
jgi:hypothetical protein